MYLRGYEYRDWNTCKCLLDGIYDVEDGTAEGRSQLKKKMAFHLLEMATVLEDLCPFRQKKNAVMVKCSI